MTLTLTTPSTLSREMHSLRRHSKSPRPVLASVYGLHPLRFLNGLPSSRFYLLLLRIDMNGTSWVINRGWASGAPLKSISSFYFNRCFFEAPRNRFFFFFFSFLVEPTGLEGHALRGGHCRLGAGSSTPIETDSNRAIPDCCDWYEVTCNRESTVIALDLAERDHLTMDLLSLTFSDCSINIVFSDPWIISITTWETLTHPTFLTCWIKALASTPHRNLSSNALSGSVPNTFDALPSFKSLDISSTPLPGAISVTLSSHPKLSTLHLSKNQPARTETFSAPGLVWIITS